MTTTLPALSMCPPGIDSRPHALVARVRRALRATPTPCPARLLPLDEPLAVPGRRLLGRDLQVRQVAVHAHVGALLLDEEFLLAGGDLAVGGDLPLPHGQVVALGYDHQGRRVQGPGGEGLRASRRGAGWPVPGARGPATPRNPPEP